MTLSLADTLTQYISYSVTNLLTSSQKTNIPKINRPNNLEKRIKSVLWAVAMTATAASNAQIQC